MEEQNPDKPKSNTIKIIVVGSMAVGKTCLIAHYQTGKFLSEIPSTCGSSFVQIKKVIKGKKYTSTYMHMLDIKVTLGQKVTSETIIGHVGGKSTGTRHGGYDRCTTGAHLHLSLSVGGWYTKYSEWKAHLQDARKTIDLPASWSTR